MAIPKLVITDIDGVWTDGGMYYDRLGNEMKKFNTSDSAGVLFLRLLDIPLAIITGEDTEIVKNRAKKLNIKYLYMGVSDKLSVAKDLCSKFNINLSQVAFIGDDINDLKLLKKVGYSGAPKNAPIYVKQNVDLVLEINGGEGAFRAFIENILVRENMFELVLNKYLENKTKLSQ